MRSPRQLKVGEEIRHALAMMFQRGDVPWPKDFVPPMVTISEVQVSPDLRNATVFFTTMNGQRAEDTRRALKDVVGHLRHGLGKAVRLRYVPALTFKVDESFEYADRIDAILNDPQVAKDLTRGQGESIDADLIEDDEG